MSQAEPHWRQELRMFWRPLLRPCHASNSTVHPTLLKTEDKATKPEHITEVLITAKCDIPCCKKYLYTEAMTVLCLSYSSTKTLGYKNMVVWCESCRVLSVASLSVGMRGVSCLNLAKSHWSIPNVS